MCHWKTIAVQQCRLLLLDVQDHVLGEGYEVKIFANVGRIYVITA